MKFNRRDLQARGFEGFVSISVLQTLKCSRVPDERGVYVILLPSYTQPQFLPKSAAGRFKGRNPSVTVSVLRNKWVSDAAILYFGKAGGNNGTTLRKRLHAYMRFGLGEPVGHWGGTYIWQLCRSRDLLVCWKTTPDVLPRAVEQELIREFEAKFKNLPFANLCH